MSTLRFKTNINCGNCIRAVSPALNQELGAGTWQVDTASPDKVLTVQATSLTAAQVQAVIEEAGFESELLS